jgi:hypothetical protein
MDEKRMEAAVRGLALGFDSSAGVVVPPLSIYLPHSGTPEQRLHSVFARAIAALVEARNVSESATQKQEQAGDRADEEPSNVWALDAVEVNVTGIRRRRRRRR